MTEFCKTLTIFEGPDGGGKSTAAQAYAEVIGGKYIHFGPLPRVRDGLARMYVEAMLPALLGYEHVVFDRCWLSEVPYGKAFRHGEDRLGRETRRMLDRLAMRCQAGVILCRPPWEVVKSVYISRQDDEYLDSISQLSQVYTSYGCLETELTLSTYDYSSGDVNYAVPFRPAAHLLSVRTAGNIEAPCILVGESFTEPGNQDALYQWPFASFTGAGCSRWLTEQLDQAGISEQKLLWVNADQDLPKLFNYLTKAPVVFALGTTAAQQLSSLGIAHEHYIHPQSHKRFHAGERYPLIARLLEITK